MPAHQNAGEKYKSYLPVPKDLSNWRLGWKCVETVSNDLKSFKDG